MMPLCLANIGENNVIRKIGGTPEVKKHLENLGFVVGGNVPNRELTRRKRNRERQRGKGCHKRGNGAQNYDLGAFLNYLVKY